MTEKEHSLDSIYYTEMLQEIAFGALNQEAFHLRFHKGS